MVATNGRPSGTAATARPTAESSACQGGRPYTRFAANTATPPASETGSVTLVSERNRACTPSGSAVPAVSRTVRPISVSAPVATITAAPLPAATAVPSYSIERRSATAGAHVGAGVLATRWDSPVRLDSSTSSPSASSTRQSAGTASPASSSITSPGTRPSAVTSACVSPRRSRTRVALASTRRRTARSALRRCTPPTSALIPMTPAIITPSTTEPTAAEAPAPTASAGVSGLSSSASDARASPRLSGSESCPGVARRVASSASRPRGEESRRLSTVPAGRACQGIRCAGTGAGRAARPIPDHVPDASAVTAAAFTARAARAGTPPAGLMVASPAPTAEADSASWALRLLTRRATATASTIICASASPGPQRRSAPHGGRTDPPKTPMPTSAAARAPAPRADTRATPCPACCSSRTDDVRYGPPPTRPSTERRWSSRLPFPATTTVPASRAAATRDEARGSSSATTPTRPTSSSPRLKASTVAPLRARSRALSLSSADTDSVSSATGRTTQPRRSCRCCTLATSTSS